MTTTKITKTQLKQLIKEALSEQVNSIYTVDGSTFEEKIEQEIVIPLKEAHKLVKQAESNADKLKLLSLSDDLDEIRRSIWFVIRDIE